MNILRPRIRWIEKFHRAEGVFALLFALLHPTFLFLGLGPAVYFRYDFVPREQLPFVFLGYLQLLLIICTAGSAMLMRVPWFKKRWRIVHYLNYAVFVSAWIHSWFLGTDTRGSSLKFLWIFFGVTAVASALWRFRNIFIKKTDMEKQHASGAVGTFMKVAQVSDIKEGSPFCVHAKDKEIALFKVGDTYTALDNSCSHAGGPLCKGKLEGDVVECPWHGSQFNMKTGEVVAGPATNPQQTHNVRVKGNEIEIEI